MNAEDSLRSAQHHPHTAVSSDGINGVGADCLPVSGEADARRCRQQFLHQQAQFETGERGTRAGVDARTIDEIGALVAFRAVLVSIGENRFVAVSAEPVQGDAAACGSSKRMISSTAAGMASGWVRRRSCSAGWAARK